MEKSKSVQSLMLWLANADLLVLLLGSLAVAGRAKALLR